MTGRRRYRQILCRALAGLDLPDERAMIRRLILKIDAREGLL
jgi:hypothetical protein